MTTERQLDPFNALDLGPVDTTAVNIPVYDIPNSTQGFQDPQAVVILDPAVELQQTHVRTQSALSAPGVWPDKFGALGSEAASSAATVLKRSPSGRSETVESSLGSSQDEQHREMSRLQSIRCGPSSNSFTSPRSLS